MRRFQHSFVVHADIARVWDFYTDIKHLEVISPPELQIRVVRETHKKLVEGAEVWLEGKLVTHSKWHSKITSLKPYQYVDEMLSGRFRVWKHVHGFEREGDGDTVVIDEIDFELPYGLLGRLFEGYVNRKLERTFAYRKQATISYFEKAR
jgi:ligand-binding SRPBCC domain-containing protein